MLSSVGLSLVLTWALLSGVWCFEFWASPERAHVQSGGNVTVSCVADESLIDCRFYMRAVGYLNPIPRRVTNHKGTSLEYFSNTTGCSVLLRNAEMAFYDLVACRGRNQDGVYKSAELSLAVSNFAPYDLQIDTKGRRAVVLPGNEFSFVCRAQNHLTYCGIWLPDGNIINLSNGSSTVTENNQYAFQYAYHGAGLDKGECGVKYTNANEQLNGIHWCSTKTAPQTLQYDYTWLIVALAPQMQYLEITGGADLSEGDVLVANCTAEDSRPMSTITWYLDDERVTFGVADVIVESPFWPDPHFKMTASQTLTRVLRPEDNGRELRCVVAHVALPGGTEEIRQRIHLQGEEDFALQMKPSRAHVLPGGDVTLACESSIPLTDCRFRLPEIGFLDVSADVRAGGVRQYSVFGTMVEYSWQESGCSLTLRGASEDLDGVVGCRGRDALGRTRTADMALAVSKLLPFELQIDKRVAVVESGGDLVFVCRSPLPLIYCSIWLPGGEVLDLTKGAGSKPRGELPFLYRYHGGGLEHGECGVAFNNITGRLNGHVWCEAQSEDVTDQSDYVTVTLAMEPAPPQLTVSPREFNVGDTIQATCRVGESRPAASVSWFLGERQLTEGVHLPADATWGWAFDARPVVVTLTRRLREEDAGHWLKCVATHPALPGGTAHAQHQLLFTTHNDSVDVTFHPNRKLINAEFCGVIQHGRRIIQGKKVALFQFPWMALISYNTNDGLMHGCGGALVSQQYVITAAHCVSSLPRTWTLAGVRLGEHDYQKEFDCEERFGDVVCAPFPQNFTAVKVIVHPRFTNVQLQDDVALLRLDHPAQFTDAVKPICLPVGKGDQYKTFTEATLVVAGWGTSENGTQSGEMRTVEVPVVSNQICADHYVKRNFLVTSKHICAGGVGGRDSCKGDSGGPLMFVDVLKSKYVQYGIVSYGAGVCGTTIPTVYTNVGRHMKWILDNME